MDKKLVRIDDLVQQRLQNESNQGGVHNAWTKMEQLLDDNERGGGAWLPTKWILPLLLLLIAGISGTAYFWNKNEVVSNDSGSITAVTNISPNKSTPNSNPLIDANAIPTEELDKNLEQTNEKQIAQHIQQNVAHYSKQKKIVSSKKSAQKNYIAVDNEGKAQDISNDQTLASSDKKSIVGNTDKKLVDQIKKEIKQGNLVINKEDKVVKKVTTPYKEIAIKQSNTTSIELDGSKLSKTTNDTQYVRDMVKIEFIPLTHREIKALQSFDLSKVYASNTAPVIAIEPLTFAEYSEKEEALLASDMGIKFSNKLSENKKFNSSVTYSEQSVLTAINNFFNQRKKFYASLQLGTLASTGYWDKMGFQFGGYLHYWLGEKTTIDLGLKYEHRPINFTYYDEERKFTLEPGVPVVGGYLHNYDELLTQHNYTVKKAHSFNIPLTVSYEISERLTAVAGVEAMFNLDMDYRKETIITKTSGQKFSDNLESSGLVNTDFKVNTTDFDNRIALGYLVGLNYNINNNNWSLFTRWNHPILSNTNNSVSKAIFDHTSGRSFIELGVNFNIGKNKKVIYLLDKDNR